MALKTYDPGQVIITFGPIIMEGYADGSFVSVEQNEQSFALTIGSSGEGVRAKSNNRSATITVTLLQSSATNSLLSAVHNVDLNSPNGDGIFPMLVKDNSGTSLYTAEKAWIQAPPTSEFDREATSREWVFETDAMIQNIGNN